MLFFLCSSISRFSPCTSYKFVLQPGARYKWSSSSGLDGVEHSMSMQAALFPFHLLPPFVLLSISPSYSLAFSASPFFIPPFSFLCPFSLFFFLCSFVFSPFLLSRERRLPRRGTRRSRGASSTTRDRRTRRARARLLPTPHGWPGRKRPWNTEAGVGAVSFVSAETRALYRHVCSLAGRRAVPTSL